MALRKEFKASDMHFRQERCAMKKDLRKSTPISKSRKSRVIEFPKMVDHGKQELEIETRLRDLTALVADLTDSGYGVLLLQAPSTREAFEELRVKEAALRWIIRVAKHSDGVVREKLWSEVENAVGSLEKTAELLLDSGVVWSQLGPANHYFRHLGPGQS
jgi:hypothetical protein